MLGMEYQHSSGAEKYHKYTGRIKKHMVLSLIHI